VNTVMNLQVPQKAANFLISHVNTGFSRRTLLHGVSYISNVHSWMANHMQWCYTLKAMVCIGPSV